MQDQVGTVTALISLALAIFVFLALAVWQPLVEEWGVLPSGAAESAWGYWETLQGWYDQASGVFGVVKGMYSRIVAPLRKMMTGYIKLVLSFYQVQTLTTQP